VSLWHNTRKSLSCIAKLAAQANVALAKDANQDGYFDPVLLGTAIRRKVPKVQTSSCRDFT
jgi:hypothetical protein